MVVNGKHCIKQGQCPEIVLTEIVGKWKKRTAKDEAEKCPMERFIYVVVRDTLVELGLRLHYAEHLAATHNGDALTRLRACLEHCK